MDISKEHSPTPWLSIWTQPRATVQRIIDSDDAEAMVLPLAALAGVYNALSGVVGRESEQALSLLALGGWIAMGVIGGLIIFYLITRLIHLTGGWLGGEASTDEIRVAVAWSYVPQVVGLVPLIILLMFFGPTLMAADITGMAQEGALSGAFLMAILGVGVMQMVLGLWSLIILLMGLGQVQGFSAWRALGNIVLASLLLLVAIMALGIVVGVLLPAFHL